jgi:hypothetical protein
MGYKTRAEATEEGRSGAGAVASPTLGQRSSEVLANCGYPEHLLRAVRRHPAEQPRDGLSPCAQRGALCALRQP